MTEQSLRKCVKQHEVDVGTRPGLSSDEREELKRLLAAQRLRYTTDTVETIAHELGYTSEFAFNRVFSRHRGQPPGRYRRLAHAA